MENHVIIDGGALLHQVFWSGSTFEEVTNEYRRYVSSKYKICQIVFNGYKLKTTIDHEHTRREACKPPCVSVLVNKNVNALYSREEFISNSNSKQQLIKLLAKHFSILSVNAKLMHICRLLMLHLIFPAKNKR